MPKLRVVFAGIFLSACAIASAHAGPPHLNVKLGLWEMTTTGQVSGMPPIPPEALAHMTPEQRARVQAAMGARMAKREKPEAHKQCVTRETLEHGFNPKRAQAEGCTMTITSSTPTVMEMHQSCTGRHKATGTFHFEAPNPETVVGNFNLVMSDGSHTMTMKYAVRGRWLGADCGSVKPAGD